MLQKNYFCTAFCEYASVGGRVFFRECVSKFGKNKVNELQLTKLNYYMFKKNLAGQRPFTCGGEGEGGGLNSHSNANKCFL